MKCRAVHHVSFVQWETKKDNDKTPAVRGLVILICGWTLGPNPNVIQQPLRQRRQQRLRLQPWQLLQLP